MAAHSTKFRKAYHGRNVLAHPNAAM